MRVHSLIFGVTVSCALLLFSSIASAECSAFPKVSWWGKLNHEKVISYVNNKHGGNWDVYVNKWEHQLNKLSSVYKNGSSVAIRSKGVELSGPVLAAYIGKVKQRIAVTRCLAEQLINSTDIEMAVSSGPSD